MPLVRRDPLHGITRPRLAQRTSSGKFVSGSTYRARPREASCAQGEAASVRHGLRAQAGRMPRSRPVRSSLRGQWWHASSPRARTETPLRPGFFSELRATSRWVATQHDLGRSGRTGPSVPVLPIPSLEHAARDSASKCCIATVSTAMEELAASNASRAARCSSSSACHSRLRSDIDFDRPTTTCHSERKQTTREQQ
jgi:hypothetical protein